MAKNDESRIDSASVSFGPRADAGSVPVPGARRIRMLWIGGLRGTTPSTEPPVAVDKDALPALLGRWSPRLELDVPNKLGSEPKQLRVALTFDSFRAFRPESVAEAIPPLRGLLAVRANIERLANEPLDIDTFAARLTAEGADPEWARAFQRALTETRARHAATGGGSPTGGGGSSLDALLAQVELPGAPPPRASSRGDEPFGRLLDTIAGASGRQRSLEKSLARDVMDQIDRTIGSQIETILHHPDFVALETAWRSLKFMVDRTDFRKGIELEVLVAGRDEAADALFSHLFKGEPPDHAAAPLVAVLVDHEFDATVRDLELLTRFARMGESLGVPFVTAVGPRFFGVPRSRQIHEERDLGELFERPEFIPYESLRREEASRFLALTFPRVLSRMPYGPQADPIRGFAWAEDATAFDALPWTRGVATVATLVGRSHAQTGWPGAIRGAHGGGLVEDMPLASTTEDEGKLPRGVDALLNDRVEADLASSGIVPIVQRIGSDSLAVVSAPTVHRPDRYDDDHATAMAVTEASLPYRILAALVVGTFVQVVDRVHERDAAHLAARIEAGLRAALGLPSGDDRVAIAVEPSESPGKLAVGAHVRLPQGSGDRDDPEFDLGIEIDG